MTPNDKSMKLSELIAQVGDENIKVQSLQTIFAGGSVGKVGVKISIDADAEPARRWLHSVAMGEQPDWVGLVLW